MPKLPFVTAFAAAGVVTACAASSDPDVTVADPRDPSHVVKVSPSVERVCSTICDALVSDYGVPADQADVCTFECADGFTRAPDSCYETVACIADHSICGADDISTACKSKVAACLASWSIANGLCRGCYAPSRTIAGALRDTFVDERGSTVVPTDLTGQPVEALFPAPSGTSYLVFPGAGASDGSYSIPDVPGCGVLLHVADVYEWSASGSPDLTRTLPGRNGTLAPPNTSFTFQLSNAAPWQTTDDIEVYAPPLVCATAGGGFSLYDETDAQQTFATPGSTTISTAPLGMRGNRFGLLLPGEVFYVVQIATQPPAPLERVNAISRILRTSFPQGTQPGVQNPVVGTLDVVPLDRSARIDWRRSEFAALAADMNPHAKLERPPEFGSPYEYDVSVQAVPGDRPQCATLDVFAGGVPLGTTDFDAGTIHFGVPPLPNAIEFLTIYYTTIVRFPNAGTGGDFILQQTIAVTYPLASFTGAPIRPLVGPVTNLRVNGRPTFDGVDGVGVTPVISWDPPKVGTPTKYVVDIGDFGGQGGNYRPAPVAELTTTETKLLVPPGMLAAGGHYLFTVSTTTQSSNPADPYGQAATISGVVSP